MPFDQEPDNPLYEAYEKMEQMQKELTQLLEENERLRGLIELAIDFGADVKSGNEIVNYKKYKNALDQFKQINNITP